MLNFSLIGLFDIFISEVDHVSPLNPLIVSKLDLFTISL